MGRRFVSNPSPTVPGMSSSGGTLLGHPVLAGARGAAEQLALAGRGRAWQLGDGDVEAALAALVQVEARATALRVPSCWPRPSPAT
ncbi:MAG: hypothetical protein QOJ60_919 [Actinomycetota bacterium]|nr:hypothetical protein [Actinomycetota bacterium]